MNDAQQYSKEAFKEWNERMAKEYDPDTYHESQSGIVAWVERMRVKRLLKLLDVQPQDRVLEVGVGAANILAKIKAKELAGIDLSPFLLEKARKRMGPDTKLVEGDAERTTDFFAPGSYDKVFCSEVLEHVQHPERVLEEMARVLAPGGVAVVSVPNEGVINRLKSLFKALGIFRLLLPQVADHMEDAWHLSVFSPGLLRTLAERYFDIEVLTAAPYRFLPIRLVARLRVRPVAMAMPEMLRCPTCKGALTRPIEDWHCATCNKTYPSSGGAPVFTGEAISISSEASFKDFFKRWPTLYSWAFAIIGPALLTGLTSAKFIRRFKPDTRILHAGSGTRRIGPQCLNLDISPYTGVDVAADIRALPFADASFDAVTCEQVLEHVPNPTKAALELRRVTKPGGYIHLAVPFVFPWHPSPSDYTRWTIEGLGDLLSDCTVVEKGIMAGPCSALVAFKASFLSIVCSLGIRPLQAPLEYLFLIILAPVKLLDLLVVHFPGAERCSADVYVILRTPE